MPKPAKPKYKFNPVKCPVCRKLYVPTNGHQVSCPDCSRSYRLEYMRQYGAWYHGRSKIKPPKMHECDPKTMRQMCAAKPSRPRVYRDK